MNVLSHSLRILYMPPVYAIISFLSYRFFRSYTYYSFIEVGTFVCLFQSCPQTHLLKISLTAYEVKVLSQRISEIFLNWAKRTQGNHIKRVFVRSQTNSNQRWLLTVSKFMLKRLLLIDFVASTATDHSANKALERKDKKALPLPVRLFKTIRSIYIYEQTSSPPTFFSL